MLPVSDSPAVFRKHSSLVSFISSASYKLSSFILQGSLYPGVWGGEGLDEVILLRTKYSKVSHSLHMGTLSSSVPLYLFPSTAGGSFSDDD